MTIRSFELLQPRSLAEASELLAKHGDDARPLGGGTTLLILMKQRAVHYPYLIDLQSIPELDRISKEQDGIRIGAMATHRAVECSPIVKDSIPVVAQAFSKIGNVRVRQTASVGGNLAHGDYRLDPPPVLLILDAELVVHGPKGGRNVPIRDFYRGVYETALEPAEILAEIKVPLPPPGSKSVYLKYSALSANDWPCVGVAALLSMDNDRCRELRLGLGGVADTPVLVSGLDIVRDQQLSDDVLKKILAIVDQQISPMSDFRGSDWYKRRMAAVFVERAIRQLQE